MGIVTGAGGGYFYAYEYTKVQLAKCGHFEGRTWSPCSRMAEWLLYSRVLPFYEEIFFAKDKKITKKCKTVFTNIFRQ